MGSNPDFERVLAAAAGRVRACSEANLALRAGLSALEDARHKVRERMMGLDKDQKSLCEGMREALTVIGHLVTLTQGQVPVSDGQLMEARYTHASLLEMQKPVPPATEGAV